MDPELVTTLNEKTKDSTKLGQLGGTLYICHNYMAAQHTESTDACRSLCVQLELKTPHPEWAEFGFAYPQMGFYIVTTSNMIWYVTPRVKLFPYELKWATGHLMLAYFMELFFLISQLWLQWGEKRKLLSEAGWGEVEVEMVIRQ
jgi:hypothetical protein